MSKQKTNETTRQQDQLLADPRFQNLLGKAETHQREFRPRETLQLEKDGLLTEALIIRTKACWEALGAARQSGMTLLEAQEVAFPLILLPDETDEK